MGWDRRNRTTIEQAKAILVREGWATGSYVAVRRPETRDREREQTGEIRAFMHARGDLYGFSYVRGAEHTVFAVRCENAAFELRMRFA